MLTLRSILQHVCRFFKSLAEITAKRLYHSSVIFMTGAAIITAIGFAFAGIGMEGGNAITAFAETPVPSSAAVAEGVSVTKAKAQVKQSQNIQQNQKDDQTSEEENNKQVASQEAAEKASLPVGPGIKESSGSADAGKAATAAPEASPAGGEAKQDESQPAEEAKSVNAMAISDDDYQVLLKIVQAEAGICDEEGRILVANVVLNRVRNGQFPNTVRGVVYAPSQFSPVSNGSINSVQVTATTKECVDRALKGEDYSQGALYFMNRGGARGRAVSWFDSHLTYLFSHDGHEFFK